MTTLQTVDTIIACLLLILAIVFRDRIKFIFAWYDMWIGAFYDAKKKYLYVFPVPMFGFIIKL